MRIEVGSSTDVTKRRKVVIEHEGTSIVLFHHVGEFYAMDNICIHRARELHKGVVLNGRLICPGHQWAFELGTGWESVKGQCQPVYDVVVDGDTVYVDVASRRQLDAAPTTTDAPS